MSSTQDANQPSRHPQGRRYPTLRREDCLRGSDLAKALGVSSEEKSNDSSITENSSLS